MKPWDAVTDRPNTPAPDGCVGLINPGCVCYSNALMQQLFACVPFRSGVLAALPTSAQNPTDEVTILAHLQSLFANLQLSVARAYDPTGFFWAFKV